MLKPEYEEAQLVTAEVREIFKSSKVGTIAGSIVRSGSIKRNSLARISRGGTVLAENLKIESLKRFKDDANEVKTDFECGIGLAGFNEIELGDIIETYEMREKPRV
jgi:translation initiation factor IF-2